MSHTAYRQERANRHRSLSVSAPQPDEGGNLVILVPHPSNQLPHGGVVDAPLRVNIRELLAELVKESVEVLRPDERIPVVAVGVVRVAQVFVERLNEVLVVADGENIVDAVNAVGGGAGEVGHGCLSWVMPPSYTIPPGFINIHASSCPLCDTRQEFPAN